jgi:hypothetical protein
VGDGLPHPLWNDSGARSVGTPCPIKKYDSGNLRLRASFAPRMSDLLAALETVVLAPARAFVALDEDGRLWMLARNAMQAVEPERITSDGASVLIEGAVPASNWQVGGLLRGIRQALFHDGLTAVDEVRVVLSGPDLSGRVRTVHRLGQEPSIEHAERTIQLVCDVKTTRRQHLDARGVCESILWSGVVHSAWGAEYQQPTRTAG